MLKNDIRVCDACAEEIPKGVKYCASITAKDKVAAAQKMLADEDPDLAITGTIDKSGRLRLDLCIDCRLSMGFKGDELVC